MKATIELPDDLMREIKVKAAREDRKLRELVADLLRRGLDAEPPKVVRHRVKLPLIHTAHPAAPGEELTPERVAEILIEQEAEWYSR